jgi:drug/metabolite transporter (DMT)-like permease
MKSIIGIVVATAGVLFGLLAVIAQLELKNSAAALGWGVSVLWALTCLLHEIRENIKKQ